MCSMYLWLLAGTELGLPEQLRIRPGFKFLISAKNMAWSSDYWRVRHAYISGNLMPACRHPIGPARASCALLGLGLRVKSGMRPAAPGVCM